jgi:hypothetical protein
MAAPEGSRRMKADLTVTKQCEFCGMRLTMTRAEMLNAQSQRKYCGPKCKADAYRAKIGPCDSCGEGPGPTRSYGLRLCVPCSNVAYGSCWGKWQADSEAHALDVRPGCQFSAYHCPLCGHWHRTSGSADPDNPETVRRLALLSALFQRTGFSLNAARGRERRWTGFSEREQQVPGG